MWLRFRGWTDRRMRCVPKSERSGILILLELSGFPIEIVE